MTGDAKETSYLFQHISVAIQSSIVIAFHGTLASFRQAIFLSIQFLACGFVLAGAKKNISKEIF